MITLPIGDDPQKQQTPDGNSDQKTMIRFHSPRSIVRYEPPDNELLVGDYHIVKGEIFMIGGSPGIGKSRVTTELAICGVTGEDWLGLKVHCPFKTMIIQNENGLRRLMNEFNSREKLVPLLDSKIRVSEPPPYGMRFTDPIFRNQLLKEIKSFQPDVIILDPWNSVAKDDNMREYVAAFEALLGALPSGAEKPAIGIVAHTRKPKAEETRTGGNHMMNLLAGSYILSSKPRSVFIMIHANEIDETDKRRVWFNPKNNNGLESQRSAWLMKEDGFSQIKGFEWDAFDEGPRVRATMTEGFVRTALSEPVDRKGAITRLVDESGLGKRTCEKALEEDGKFSHIFEITDDGYYQLK